MRRLTEAQLRELKRIDLYGSYNNLNYFVGESLRKRGLVERYTTYPIGADYADKAGVQMTGEGVQLPFDIEETLRALSDQVTGQGEESER